MLGAFFCQYTMSVLGLDHYNLRVDSELIEVLRVFYSTIVGLEEGLRPPLNSVGYWLYAGGKDVLHLSQTQPAENRASNNIQGTFDHVAFSCCHVAQFESRLLAHHIPYKRSHVPQTGQIQLFFHDPAGNKVELNFTPENV